MQIDSIICPEHIEEKIESKHNVTCREARQVVLNQPRIRFAEKGHTKGDDVYAAFGQTFSGRYLLVFFIYKPTTKSARDMSSKERKAYGRK